MNVAVPRRIKFFVGGGVAAFVLAVVAVAGGAGDTIGRVRLNGAF